jgi:hypothetical protein
MFKWAGIGGLDESSWVNLPRLLRAGNYQLTPTPVLRIAIGQTEAVSCPGGATNKATYGWLDLSCPQTASIIERFFLLTLTIHCTAAIRSACYYNLEDLFSWRLRMGAMQSSEYSPCTVPQRDISQAMLDG